MLKEIKKQNKGITLIALVITIIILIILAGVSINLVLGDNGIITKALEAKEENRAATIEEKKEIWNFNRNMDDYFDNSTIQSLEEFVLELVNNGLLTEEDKNEILSTGQITIGSKNIVFEKYTYISNKEELENFRDNVNDGYTYKNETVVLTNDIDLGGIESDSSTWWTSIGSNENDIHFEGTFDGNNHSVTNMYLKESGNIEFIAFFSAIKNGTIKNLIVDGELIAGAQVSAEDNPCAAGIVGVTYGKCEIINCTNNATVIKESTGRETAGVLGCVERESQTTLNNCINTGTISGGNASAGLVGTIYGSLIINDSYNEGNVGDIYSKYVGGLVGRSVTGAVYVNINDSYNKGCINSVRYASGIISYINGGNITINNTYNEGVINLTNRDAISYAGGIIGRVIYTAGRVTITNSYNTKNINAQKETKSIVLGGIMGESNANDVSIINCYNLGDLEGDYTSGICGLISGSSTTILNPTLNIINSYNKGSVTGRLYTTGIVRLHGTTGTVNIQNVYYLDTSASIGVQNTASDDAIPLSEIYMKSQDFVNDLNNNLSSVETNIQLNTWKYVENDYPIFE